MKKMLDLLNINNANNALKLQGESSLLCSTCVEYLLKMPNTAQADRNLAAAAWHVCSMQYYGTSKSKSIKPRPQSR